MYNVKLTVVITLHSGNGAGYIRLHPVVEITTIVVSPRLLHPLLKYVNRSSTIPMMRRKQWLIFERG